MDRSAVGLAVLKGEIPKWAKGDGSGYGYGYGYGYGDGYGYGSGYGIQQYQRYLFAFSKKLKIENGGVVLFKSVRKHSLVDDHTGKIKYEGVVECPDWDDNESRECGGGLHLSATKEDCLSFYSEGTVLRCFVKLEDFLVYKDNYKKVRCKKVTVLGEV